MSQLNQPSPLEQWLAITLTLRRDLRFDLRSIASENQVVLEDPIRSRFFQIGLAEFRLVSAFDGIRPLGEILKQLSCEERGASEDSETPNDHQAITQHAEPLTQEQSIRIVQWLLQNNLAYIAALDQTQRIEDQVRNATRAKWFGILNPLAIKVPLFNPNRVLARMDWVGNRLFSVWFLIVWFVLGGIACNILISDWQKIGEASLQIFSGFHWFWLLLAWIGLKFVHETAHALACKKFGGDVPEAGILFILFTPLAYVNVTSMWRLSSRWQRIVISAAGIYVELFMSFVCLAIWQNSTGILSSIAFNIFVMASVNTVLFNANPLMRFDGYFILSDLVQIPNLYTKSLRWLSERFKNVAFGIPLSSTYLTIRERVVLPVYAVLAWCWKVMIGLSLLIAASVLLQGAGIILTAMGILMWYAIPVWQQYRWFWAAQRHNQIDNRRLAISGVVGLLLIGGLFSIFAAPATKSAPALVQFSGEQILRARSEGFIKTILVQTGQRVFEGQPLLVLDSPQLELETKELEKQIQEAVIQSRIVANNHELAKAQAETERVESLRHQLAEKKTQQAGLIVTAPANGMVFKRGLENQIGKFVQVGDELLTFAQSFTKQVVVSVDQRDWDSIKSHEDKIIQLMFSGHPVVIGKLNRIVPKASIHPLHPSLIATNGGPLSVKPVSQRESEDDSANESMELLTPRFTIELELDASAEAQLFAGQTGYAYFRAKRQTMASYLYLAISHWFTEKLELASQ
jgi:putative peptide zinc metalloprotease protein